MRRAALMTVLAFLAVSSPPAAQAAFEAPDDDPARLALASSGPAWPIDGPVAADEPLVFGSPSTGVVLSTLRWEAAPGLERNGAAGSIRIRSIALTLRVAQLLYGGYSETRVAWGVVRPVGRAGWGWGIGAGREGWRVDGSPGAPGVSGRPRASGLGLAGWFFCGNVGFSPRPGVRAALRVVEHAGPAAASSSGSLEIGATADPLPGWRLGTGYETARAGGLGRLKLGVECRPARAIALRLGFVPSDESFSAGLGVERGGFGIDIARRSHPRLGWVQGLAFRAARKGGA